MLQRALLDLAGGKPILLYDLDGREQETDMVVAGQAITPDHISTLRMEAGGLICVAIPAGIAGRLGLPYMHDVLHESGSETLRELSSSPVPYGGSPAFSVTINHRDNYTGITDLDRNKTICELSKLIAEMSGDPSKNWAKVLADRFRSPGHIHILIGASLPERRGHTELSLKLAEMADLEPVMVICEMLDGTSHRALSKEEAAIYASRHGLVLIEADDIMNGSGVA